MDVLAPTTMKNAAKCDTSCELQNLVSHQNFERILHFGVSRSMSVGVSVHPHTSTPLCGERAEAAVVFFCIEVNERRCNTPPTSRPCSVGVRRARRSSMIFY